MVFISGFKVVATAPAIMFYIPHSGKEKKMKGAYAYSFKEHSLAVASAHTLLAKATWSFPAAKEAGK